MSNLNIACGGNGLSIVDVKTREDQDPDGNTLVNVRLISDKKSEKV